MVRIDNYRIICTSDRHVAPECRAFRIAGRITGHPAIPDGELIETSHLDIVDGTTRIASCASRDYYLGTPSTHQPDVPKERLDTMALLHQGISTKDWHETQEWRQMPA